MGKRCNNLDYDAISADKPLLESWKKYSREGVILCDKRLHFLYCNEAAYKMLASIESVDSSNLSDILSLDKIETLMREKTLTFAEKLRFYMHPLDDKRILVFLYDQRKEFELNNRLQLQEKINSDLQNFLVGFGDDTVYITDGDGITLFAGKHITETCGIDQNYFMGKSVFELERTGVFSPSVTVKVLESGKQEAVIQKTKTGIAVLSIGFPIFNTDKRIVKVVSLSRDIADQRSFSTMIQKAHDFKHIDPNTEQSFPNFITQSDKLYNLLNMVRVIAMVDSTVLITGETGVGKDLVANLIHRFSPRAEKPFIKVSCGAISETLVESELFGYEPGSFTGAKQGGKAGYIEAANHGTIFLDEIGELPLSQQVKLLHVLQEKKITRVGGTDAIEIDVRFISATNRDLMKMVQDKTFREDLYYRLNVVPIEIPPLRERKEDIALLVQHFLKFYSDRYRLSRKISKEAVLCLSSYLWPGNVRELEHTIERLVVTAKNPIIELSDLPKNITQFTNDEPNENTRSPIKVEKIIPLQKAVEETERHLIQLTLEKYETVQKVAEVLQVNPSTISRKISRYGLHKRPL